MEMNRKEFGLAGKDEAAISVVSRIERIVDQEFALAGLQRFHPDLRPFPVRRDRRITKDGEKDGTPVGEKVRKSVGYLVCRLLLEKKKRIASASHRREPAD